MDKVPKENLSLTQKKTDGFLDSPYITMPKYISEVDKIAIIRELYKTKTQAYLDKGIQEELEEHKRFQLQKGTKIKQLINFNYTLLQEMENQRSTYESKIQEVLKMCTPLVGQKQIQEEGDCPTTKSSIRTLLSDIKERPTNH